MADCGECFAPLMFPCKSHPAWRFWAQIRTPRIGKLWIAIFNSEIHLNSGNWVWQRISEISGKFGNRGKKKLIPQMEFRSSRKRISHSEGSAAQCLSPCNVKCTRNSKWCEALSAVSHLHEMCAAQMANENFDLNHRFYLVFCCQILFVAFNCRKRK